MFLGTSPWQQQSLRAWFKQKWSSWDCRGPPTCTTAKQDGLSPIWKARRENTLSTMGTHNQIKFFNFSDIISKLYCSLSIFKLWYQQIQASSCNKYHCSYYAADCRGTHYNLLNCRPCLLSWIFLGINLTGFCLYFYIKNICKKNPRNCPCSALQLLSFILLPFNISYLWSK